MSVEMGRFLIRVDRSDSLLVVGILGIVVHGFLRCRVVLLWRLMLRIQLLLDEIMDGYVHRN